MSKTDKTRPFWVRMVDSPGNYREVHRHENGRPCDLPAEPGPDTFDWRRCHYDWRLHALFADGLCGCSMCHGSEENRRSNRRDRYRAKRELRRLDD